jgi:hypothetical protein
VSRRSKPYCTLRDLLVIQPLLVVFNTLFIAMSALL